MSQAPSLLEQADKSSTTLNYAVELTKTAAKIGFDWPTVEGVIAKIHEELNEVQYEITQGNIPERVHDEIGDLLFACTNLARHLNVDPETALQSTNTKFTRRFEYIERQVAKQKKSMTDVSLEDLDALWDQAKSLEKNQTS